MLKAKLLIGASALMVPSMASACDLHGDFGGFGGFGGMHFSNMSLLSDQSSDRGSAGARSASHTGSQAVRHVRFGSGFERSTRSEAPDIEAAESNQNPDEIAPIQ